METLVVGVAVLPAFLCWSWLFAVPVPTWIVPRAVLAAMSFVPAYLVFSVALATLSALSTRLLGWRTQPDQCWKLADLEWPLLDWMRYMVSTHVVRVLVGTFFRASPIWTLYVRMNGARIGRSVYVNTLSISDHNLLEFGDRVVVGESVLQHLRQVARLRAFISHHGLHRPGNVSDHVVDRIQCIEPRCLGGQGRGIERLSRT